jgi:hypothetical protein
MTQFFGDPWPSGICEEGRQVATPINDDCEMCGEGICDGDQGSFVTVLHGDNGNLVGRLAPLHRECSLRNVMGGIGHLTNHLKWCVEERDPDAGLGYRESALQVWKWVADNGFSTSEET